MPPLSPRDAVNKGKADTVTVGERGKGRDGKEVFEAFEGPSKPRLIYERPGGRELPKVRVSRGLGAWHNARRLTMMCVQGTAPFGAEIHFWVFERKRTGTDRQWEQSSHSVSSAWAGVFSSSTPPTRVTVVYISLV